MSGEGVKGRQDASRVGVRAGLGCGQGDPLCIGHTLSLVITPNLVLLCITGTYSHVHYC
jgi:hypothetical protein